MVDERVVQTKTKVLEATLYLMCRDGLANISVEAISKESGVAKTTIYRHWDSLDDIVLDLLDELVFKREKKNSGRLKEDLISDILGTLKCFKNEKWAKCIPDVIEKARIDVDFKRKKEQIMVNQNSFIKQSVEWAKVRGEIDSGVDSEMIVDRLMGPVVMNFMVKNKVVSQTYVETLVEDTLKAIKYNK